MIRKPVQTQANAIARTLKLTVHKRRLSTYTPISGDIYNAAITGFITGAVLGADVGISPTTSQAALADEAALFGQAVDAALAATSPSSAQVAFVRSFAQAATASRYNAAAPATSFGPVVDALSTAYAAASAVFVAGSGTAELWQQPGGTGTPLSPLDATAPIEALGGTCLNSGGGLGCMAIGSGNTAYSNSGVIGGSGNIAGGANCSCAGGVDNATSGNGSACLAGQYNTANADCSCTLAGEGNIIYAHYAIVHGMTAFGLQYGRAFACGCMTTPGDTQGGDGLVLTGITSGSGAPETVTLATSDGFNLEFSVVGPYGDATAAMVHIDACASDGTNTAGWTFDALCHGSSTLPAVLDGSTLTTGAPTIESTPTDWTISVSCDGTTGYLHIKFTGTSGSPIRCTASISYAQGSY